MTQMLTVSPADILEAAERIHISTETVQRLVECGALIKISTEGLRFHAQSEMPRRKVA